MIYTSFQPIRYLSLFSGIGGFELGIERVCPDSECVGYSEIDRFAIQCYSSHFPAHRNCGDITQIDITSLPDFDLLVGGSPCQDLSIAKKNRQGLDGERSKLFFKYLEILKVKRPKWFILENVNSMTKENKQIITDLIKEIYPDVRMTMINAALVSAQSRKRCFWTNFDVSQPEDRNIFLKDILEKEVDEKYFLKKDNFLTKKTINENDVKVAGTLDEGTWSKRYEQIRRVYDTTGQSPTLPTGTGGGVIPKIIMPDKSKTVRSSGRGSGLGDKHNWDCIPIGNVNPSNNGMNGLVYSDEGKSPTLTTNKGEGNKIIQGDSMVNDFRIRKLTPTECEFLQSFPKDYTKYGIEIFINIEAYYNVYGKSTQTNAIKILQTLQKAIDSSNLQERKINEFITFFKNDILQSGMYETEFQIPMERECFAKTIQSSCNPVDCCNTMFTLWKEIKSGYTPQRQEQNEQLFKKFTSIVQRLPYSFTQVRRWVGFEQSFKSKERFDGQIFVISKISDSSRYKLLGNAVNVEVISHIMRCLINGQSTNKN
jgi:DNA-cytosine methyltransferase